jgi:hypothetical protein
MMQAVYLRAQLRSIPYFTLQIALSFVDLCGVTGHFRWSDTAID